MPGTSQLQYRRTHNLLLIAKLLNGRDNVSPFTLVIDSLDQSGKALVQEITQRAKLSKVNIVYISFETLRKPSAADSFITASRISHPELLKQTASYVKPTGQRTLFVLDSINALAATTRNLPGVLSGFISPTSSLIATYHDDIHQNPVDAPYSPNDLTLLHYLATTVLTTHSLAHKTAEKAARDRSLPSPLFGLQSEMEGLISSMGSNDARGVVVEMEYRRKSGRGVREWFFLPSLSLQDATISGMQKGRERAILLEDHPIFWPSEDTTADDESLDTTFNLNLTDKQRRDREGVVLPCFDAQRDEGVGEGGRILYDMGSEDDFDEEEDEI